MSPAPLSPVGPPPPADPPAARPPWPDPPPPWPDPSQRQHDWWRTRRTRENWWTRKNWRHYQCCKGLRTAVALSTASRSLEAAVFSLSPCRLRKQSWSWVHAACGVRCVICGAEFCVSLDRRGDHCVVRCCVLARGNGCYICASVACLPSYWMQDLYLWHLILDQTQICIPDISRIEYYFHGESDVHRKVFLMHGMLHARLVPGANHKLNFKDKKKKLKNTKTNSVNSPGMWWL